VKIYRAGIVKIYSASVVKIYSASVVKIYRATNSMARFYNKHTFLCRINALAYNVGVVAAN
jgi:hypothetical protein